VIANNFNANLELRTTIGMCKKSNNVTRNVVKIPPTSMVSPMCISKDCVGLLLREGGGASASPFDLIQFCFNLGRRWREAALGRGF
jgi:hypothetical protein